MRIVREIFGLFISYGSIFNRQTLISVIHHWSSLTLTRATS